MARKTDRKALGRGLSALLGDTETAVATASGAKETTPGAIPIDLIRANPAQPRQTFGEAELKELADSLREHGVIQPVLLRPDPEIPGRYQIVAGERRWRAAQLAGLHEIPAIVRDLDDRRTLEFAIVENVQRVDLDPVEEARGYSRLIESFDYTQERVAAILGKSRSHIANMTRLLALPDPVLDHLRAGRLSIGHARALVTAPAPITLAEKAVAEGLTVRQVEALARKAPGEMPNRKARQKPGKDADTRMLEGDLSAAIGMRVTIDHGVEGGGQLSIRYKSLDQLDALCRKLSE